MSASAGTLLLSGRPTSFRMAEFGFEATVPVVAPSRAEAGNLLFDLREKVDAPGHFFIVECWTDRAVLERHFSEPYLVDLVEKHKRMLDGPLVLHEVRPVEA